MQNKKKLGLEGCENRKEKRGGKSGWKKNKEEAGMNKKAYNIMFAN